MSDRRRRKIELLADPSIGIRWVDDSNRKLPGSSRWISDLDPDVQPGALYYCHDLSGELVYVGFTIDPTRRLKTHRSKSWWSEVVHVEVVWYLDQVEARIAENRIFENGKIKYCGQRPMMRYRKDYGTEWLHRGREEFSARRRKSVSTAGN